MSEHKQPDKSNKDLRDSQNSEVRYVPVEYVNDHEEEINILDLGKTLWYGRKEIALITLICALFGFFHIYFGPSEYESNAILLQETRQQGTQGQRLLQQLGGVNFGDALPREDIPPSLYPQIVESVEFKRGLLFEDVRFMNLGVHISLLDYFENHYKPPFRDRVYNLVNRLTFGLPSTVYRGMRNIFRSEVSLEETESVYNFDDEGVYLQLTRSERSQLDNLSGRIEIEQLGNLTMVKTRLPDPVAAAQLNRLVVDRIQKYVIAFRIEKAQQDLEFIQSQYEESKERYEEIQLELARFRDQNVSLVSAVAQTRLEDLQNQRNLRFGIYNSMSQQLEQARLNVQEETPVFNILQRSMVPHSTVSVSILFYIAPIIFGLMAGVIYIYIRQFMSALVSHIKNDK